MLRLRKILLCDYLYYTLLILILLISLIRINIPKKSLYKETIQTTKGTIIEYDKKESSIVLTIKAKEKLIVYYYIKENNNINMNIGDKIEVTGEFNRPKQNTTKNLFNYQRYLYQKDIFFIVNATNIKIISKTKNPYYKIKQLLIKKTTDNKYLKAFILGDKSDIESKVQTSYQENGISHLFAISGMHITLLSSIILKILKNISEKTRYIITSILLIFYLLLIGLSPSALRGVLFFIFFSINKIYYFYIKPHYIFIIVLLITLLINPYYIFDVGFQYSFIISLTLILKSNSITGNYIMKLLKISVYSLLVSLPISLYNYHQINILGILYNVFFVPLVSIIIFPLTLIVIIIKPILPLYKVLVDIMEKISLILNNISIGKLIFKRMPIFFYIIYFTIISLILKSKKTSKKLPHIVLLILLIIHYMYPKVINDTSITMLDVGQGDSTIIKIKDETILIDTGGKMEFGTKGENNKIVKNTTIPYLKSEGIKKLSYVVLTHGDADHMGEAKYLINNYKVENVIFNCGDYNNLERELIKVLDKKKIPYHSCIKGLNIDDNKLYFLNNKDYGNENDNSSVIYTELNNHKFLFMGDAGIEVEKNLIEKYNLKDIDVLKVGHHGSKTSSSKNFINEINPKYSLISVGEDNKFGHPNNNVLKTLENSKIYRTDQDGSIMFKIKNNKLQIETCAP